MMKTSLLVVFLLTHSSETQAILTVSKISVQKHQTIIIPCLYDERYVSNRKYVSSGGVWLFSREVEHSRVCVSDDRAEKVFTVTLTSAEESDSGPYWCAVDRPGSDPHARLDLEVIKGKARLHVSSQSVSGYEGGSVSVLCHGAHRWCRIGGSCVGRAEESSDKTHVSGDGGEALSVSLSELKIEDSGWYFCSDGEYQMPVHISVTKARPVTVPYTDHSTAVSRDQHYSSSSPDFSAAWAPSLLWRAVLGAMVPVIFCLAVALIGRNIRRKRRADAAGPSEGKSDQQWPSRSGKNKGLTCENLYKNTGIKQNIQENEKNEELTCENLYENTGIKHNMQGNEKNEEVTCENLYEIKQNMQGNEKCKQVTCDDIYETMTGNTQNIQENEKHSRVEDLYESMTGNKQTIQCCRKRGTRDERFHTHDQQHLHNEPTMDPDGLLFIFILIRLSGTQDVNTVRTVSVQSGQSIIIPCLYKHKYAFSHMMSEDSRKVLTVHMEDLRESDSAQFSCPAVIPSGLDKRENFSLEVTAGRPRLSVRRQSETVSEGDSVSVSCVHQGGAPVQWCRLHGLCVTDRGTIDGAEVEIRHDQEHVMTVILSKLKMKNTGWYLCSTRQLQMPVHITVHNHTDEITPSARNRTAIFFLLAVILEILLMVIIHSALKLLTFIKERFLRPAEEGQYVMMHGEQSTHGCEEAYEIMAELTANTEPHRESDYVNFRET